MTTRPEDRLRCTTQKTQRR